MKRYILLITIIFQVFTVSASGRNDIKSEVSKAAEHYLKNYFFNGTFFFAKGNDEILRGAKGVYAIGEDQLKPDQIMPIASGTKPITAAGILRLQDQGKLNVQDKVAKYLDKKSDIWQDNEIPSWAEEISIHDLLTHTSGLTEYFMNMNIDPSLSHSDINRQIAQYAAKAELSSKPGKVHKYTNTNFVLLGLIIEKVSGKLLSDFFQEEFFTPLKMHNTHLAKLDEVIKMQKDSSYTPYPRGYFVVPTGVNDGPHFAPAKVDFIVVPYADGGIISNAKDLLNWHQSLHQGKILSKKSYKEMTTKHLLVENKQSPFKSYTGYGIFITEFNDKDIMYHHAGKAIGYRSESGYIPNRNFYYAILSNVMQIPVPQEMKDKVDLSKPENQLDIRYFEHAIIKSLVTNN